MQKLLSVIMLILIIIASLTGCQTKSSAVSVKSTIDTGFQPYYEMSDGSWQCDDAPISIDWKSAAEHRRLLRTPPLYILAT